MEFLVLINALVLIFAGSALMYALSSKSRSRVQTHESDEK